MNEEMKCKFCDKEVQRGSIEQIYTGDYYISFTHIDKELSKSSNGIMHSGYAHKVENQ